ncbi:hypothetical protein EVAR_82029_1 [Eumeta japonica]|uniref:Uncharacterized protein n=1 Tax=Eumeta variegata TaxID=151549 RepID=A0A4C1XN82_EUMVA|nr:hypothetical protein EVAR_82029_1 [Eumeta japonica]
MCRLCLCNDNLKPIFCGFPNFDNYSAVLMLTTGLQIEENDGFPQMICSSCTELVRSAFNLRITSQNSENKLKKLGYKKYKYDKKHKVELKSGDPFTIELDSITKTEKNETINCNEAINDETLELKPLHNIKEEDDIQDENHTFLSHDDDHGIQETPLKPDLHTIAGDITESENVHTNERNVKTLSRKEKRAVYMSLVEGMFDPKGPIKCKVCKKTLSKWASFMTHSKLHLGFKFVCELNRHCRSYHGMSRELACRHCDYLALDNTQLVCEKCPQMFKSRRHLARHTYTTHTCKQYSYKCPICAHIYRNLKYIRVHLKKLHGLTTKDAKIVKIKL